MYKLHGFFTQNSMKTLYVLDALGVDYEFCYVDLMTGASQDPFERAPVEFLVVDDENVGLAQWTGTSDARRGAA